MSSGDSIVDSVVQKFTERSRLGQVKYGKTLDRGDLTVHEWITHAQEELMDHSSLCTMFSLPRDTCKRRWGITTIRRETS